MSTPSAVAGLTTYTLDPAHTSVEFSGKHMMFTTVKGHFRKVDGTIQLDPSDLSKAVVDVTIDAGSLESGQEMRDGHLKGEDFLHVGEHPNLTFKSTSVEPTDATHAKVHGDLTIRGTSKPVVLDAELSGFGTSPYGKKVAGFSATTRINRSDWGLTWNVGLEAGGLLVSDEIKISIDVEAFAQD